MVDIPVLSDLVDGVKWIIDFFFNKAPAPIKFLFFLVLIIIFATFINFTIQMMGVHCDSKLNVVKVSALEVWTNYKLARLDKDDKYNANSYTPGMIVPIGYFPVPQTCFIAMCNISGKFYYKYATECDNETLIYPYKVSGAEFFRCSDCSGTVDDPRISGGLISDDQGYLCFGDSYRYNTSGLSTLKLLYFSFSCGDNSKRCIPPLNYYYNYSDGKYSCSNDAVCGINITANTTTYMIDEELKNVKAELMYPPTLNNKDIRGAVRFKCSGDMKPDLTFFGIPVFDYRIWLIGTLITMMILFLTHIGQQSRIP